MNVVDERVRDALRAQAEQVAYDLDAAWHRQLHRADGRKPLAIRPLAVAASAVVLAVAGTFGWRVVSHDPAVPAAPVTADRTITLPASAFAQVGQKPAAGAPIVVTGTAVNYGTPLTEIAWIGWAGENPMACQGAVPTATLSPVGFWNCTGLQGPLRTKAGFGFGTFGGYLASDRDPRPDRTFIAGTVNDKVASLTVVLDDGTQVPAQLFGRSSGFPATLFRALLDFRMPDEFHYVLVARDVYGHVLGREPNFISTGPAPTG